MYTAVLDLKGKNCLVVGGGRVAVRKTIAFLRAGARVTVVAKECCTRMRSLAGRITLFERPFEDADIHFGVCLVTGATNDPQCNRAVSRRAEELGIFCNIVDQPALCSFIVPALVRQGSVTVAITTGGVAPRLTRYLRGVVSRAILPLHGELADCLGKVRLRIRRSVPAASMRAEFWEELFEEDPTEVIAAHGWEGFRCRVEQITDKYERKAQV